MGGDAEKIVRTLVALADQCWFWQLASVGELSRFGLHAPQDFIVGGGVFSHAPDVPLPLAWDAFGSKNGVGSLAEMQRRIARSRSGARLASREQVLGVVAPDLLDGPMRQAAAANLERLAAVRPLADRGRQTGPSR